MKCIWCPAQARENQFTCADCVGKSNDPLSIEERLLVRELPPVNDTISIEPELEDDTSK